MKRQRRVLRTNLLFAFAQLRAKMLENDALRPRRLPTIMILLIWGTWQKSHFSKRHPGDAVELMKNHVFQSVAWATPWNNYDRFESVYSCGPVSFRQFLSCYDSPSPELRKMLAKSISTCQLPWSHRFSSVPVHLLMTRSFKKCLEN